MSEIVAEGTRIRAQAGALLSQIGNRALELGLTGMEFAAGIPGTAGGAVVMNAGAYGGEMKDILAEVTVLNRDGEILRFRQTGWNWVTAPASSKRTVYCSGSSV